MSEVAKALAAGDKCLVEHTSTRPVRWPKGGPTPY